MGASGLAKPEQGQKPTNLAREQRQPNARLVTSMHPAMQRSYDLFEKLTDGTMMWRESVQGYSEALRKLTQLALRSQNEWQVMHLPTKTVIAVLFLNPKDSQSYPA